MKKGFTLIELMIVVAIIAIIAAIAIPSLLRSRIAANETAAVGALKQIVSHNATMRATDSDGNGLKDYWTYDLAGFYALVDAEDNALKFIDIAMAKADLACDPLGTVAALYYEDKNNLGFVTLVLPTMPLPKQGYLYDAIDLDDTPVIDGGPLAYNVNAIRPLAIVPAGAELTSHGSKFAFVATPEDYNSTGVRIFIVNEEGVVYGVDNGESVANAPRGEEALLVFGAAAQEWVGQDPTTSKAVHGKFVWTQAE